MSREWERDRRMAALVASERRERIELVKVILKVAAGLVAFLAASAGLLYLAVRLVRLAWGAS